MNNSENSRITDLISVEGLSKTFDKVKAVDDISFNIKKGELFGFLGPNGAGKTTTINILTGLANPDSGTITISGIDCIAKPRGAQHLIGVVPDESNLYPELSGYDNLCFCAALYGMNRVDRETRARKLLEDFELSDSAHRRFATYSKGMKRKITIAAGIIHKPEILFLDEPTTGIDVASARQLRQLIAKLHRNGTTIFLTTHYIEEAERLCQRIAFIVKGRIVRIDTVENLIQPVQNKHVLQITYTSSIENIRSKIGESFPNLNVKTQSENMIQVESDNPILVGPLVRFFEDLGAEITEARKIQPALEDVFVQITGIEADTMRKEKGGKGK